MRTGGRADMTNLTVAFRNFVNAPYDDVLTCRRRKSTIVDVPHR